MPLWIPQISMAVGTIERPSVVSTSLTEARMVCVRSEITSTCTSGGMLFSKRGSRARTPSTASITLAPGCLNTSSSTAGLLSCQAETWRFCGPSIAWPTSRTRTGPPLR